MLHYRTEGRPEEPTLVFLHGFMGSGCDWDAVVSRMQTHARCVRIDLPGHGASVRLSPAAYTFEGAVQAVADVLDEVGAGRATLVGYSMGGRIALAVALAHPERVRRLVMASASPGLYLDEERAARCVSDEQLAVRLETGDLASFVAEWYRQPLFESLVADPEMAAAIYERRLRNDPAELARALRGLGTGRQPSYWGRLASAAFSIVAVAGAHDGKYVEIAQQMALQNPRIRAVILPNIGHNVPAEAPATFVDVLTDVLRQP